MTKQELEKKIHDIENRLTVWLPVSGQICPVVAGYYLEDIVKALLENLELDVSRVYPNPPEIKTVVTKRKNEASK